MKQPSVYLKMRVLGAIDTVAGRTRDERVKNVAAMTFLDEEGNPRQFTWRTIQTWFYQIPVEQKISTQPPDSPPHSASAPQRSTELVQPQNRLSLTT